MLQPNQVNPADQTVDLKQIGWIPMASLANGLRILAGSGTGKTVLSSAIALQLFTLGRANLMFDPTRSQIDIFLQRAIDNAQQQGLSPDELDQLLERIIYVDLSGRSGYVVPFSLFHRYDDEPLAAVADRIMDWVLLSMPESKGAAVEGFTSIDKVLRPIAKLMAAMQPDMQITEVPDLLRNWKKEPWKSRLEQAAVAYPQQTAEALTFLRQEYAKWSNQVRERRLNLLEVWLAPFRYSPAFRATFGATQPGLDYDRIVANGQTVLFDASGLQGEYRQLMLTWVLLYSFTTYIRHRGSGQYPPIGLMIDEISTLYASSPESMLLFAQKFGEIVHVLKRQYRIHPVCVVHQSVSQLHPQMAAHLAALGNQIIGRPADFESAMMLSEQLFDYRSVVKRWEPVYGYLPDDGPQVIDFRPLEYTQEEVRQIQAQQLMQLDTFRFLARLTRSEGSGHTRLKQLDTRPIVGNFPDPVRIDPLRQQLAEKSGVSMSQILTEIEARRGKQVQANSGSAIVPNKPQYDSDGYKIDA